MKAKGNGGCLCGQVRLQIVGVPGVVLECHCKDCQKSTGGGAVLAALCSRDAVELLQGELAGYSVVGDSGGEVRRCFCSTCGTPVYSELAKYPDHLVLKSGIWDIDPGLRPNMAIWTDSAPAWHHVPDDIPSSPRAPG